MATPPARYIIFLIGDGMGPNHVQAVQNYRGAPAVFQSWQTYWVSTYSVWGKYEADKAWADFTYIRTNPTDSAAAATALFSGEKTANENINVSANFQTRYVTIADQARAAGMAVGAVTSVPISNATPGAWCAHNRHRDNGFALADECLWGDPNTTGSHYGGYGPTYPPVDVLLGGGHPAWMTSGNIYVSQAIYTKLVNEDGQPGAFTFVERIAGQRDAGARLISAAQDPQVTRLAGLFGGPNGNLNYRRANNSGHNPENPTLAELTRAALTVLARDPQGFVLLVEGGAIDWASHNNRMDEMLGEGIALVEAVQAVMDWIEDPNSPANWANTLVIVTGDHETGYLSAKPEAFMNEPLGEISARTLALEKTDADSGYRASWEDRNNNQLIDSGEEVYWAWNVTNHTNALAPLYAWGTSAGLFDQFRAGIDPVRGKYIDNTDVFAAVNRILADVGERPVKLFFPLVVQ